jgi:hypothetical protein
MEVQSMRALKLDRRQPAQRRDGGRRDRLIGELHGRAIRWRARGAEFSWTGNDDGKIDAELCAQSSVRK